MRTIGIIFYLMISLMLFSGCASSGFLMAKPEVSLFGETYSPRNEETTIEVFITNLPTQEYIEFAQITCKDTNDKWNLNQIIVKAREIGADGIIVMGKAGSYGVGFPIGYSSYVISEDYGMTAIAIKYK